MSRPFAPNYVAVRLTATKQMQWRLHTENVWVSERDNYMLHKTKRAQGDEVKNPGNEADSSEGTGINNQLLHTVVALAQWIHHRDKDNDQGDGVEQARRCNQKSARQSIVILPKQPHVQKLQKT